MTEIEAIVDFLNLYLAVVKKTCADVIQTQYVVEYGQLPESNQLMFNQRKDSNYKRHQKLIQWYNAKFEEKKGGLVKQEDVYQEYCNSIVNGELFSRRAFYKFIYQGFAYLVKKRFGTGPEEQQYFENVARKV